MSKDKLVLVVAAFLFLGASRTELIAQDVAKILESVKVKQQDVNCVWYKVEGTTLFPKGSASHPDFPGFPWKDTAKPLSMEVLIDFVEGQYQWRLNRYGASFLWDDPVIDEDFRFFIYEDERLGCHRLDTTNKKAAGLLNELSQDGIFYKKTAGDLSVDLIAFMMPHGFIPTGPAVDRSNVFGRAYDLKQFRYAGKAVLNGNECDVIKIRNPDKEGVPLGTREIWIHQGQIVRIADTYVGSKAPDDVIVLEYSERSGVCVPVKFKRTLCTAGCGPDLIERVNEYRLTDFKLNPDYQSIRQDFDLTPGMRWGDEENMRGLVVNENLQFVSLAAEDVGQPARRGSIYPWLFLSGIIVLGLAITVRVVNQIRKKDLSQ